MKLMDRAWYPGRLLWPAALVPALTLCGVASAAPAPASLTVGAARVEMTGPFGPSQTGAYDHEHVYARAIVVDNGQTRAALVTYDGRDSGFDMVATRQAMADALHVPLVNVLVTHTHTHSASIDPPGPPTPGKPGVLSPQLVEAVRKAMAQRVPARMRFGTGKSYLNVNRDAISPLTRKWAQGTNLDAASDKAVQVLSFETPEGKPLAAYVTYAMHPIDAYVLGVVTGDFAEAMERYVEKAFGDDTIVEFAQSASGDQNPLYLRPSTNAMASRNGTPVTGFVMDRETQEAPLRLHAATEPAADPKVIDRLFRFIDGEGALLGEEVIRVLSQGLPVESKVSLGAGQENLSCPGHLRTSGSTTDPATREGVTAVYQDAPPTEFHIGLIGMGDVAIASVNGEVYTLVGQRMKEEAPMRNTIIATLANERVRGYIPDDASYGHETFQVLDSRVKQGCAEMGIAAAVNHLETAYLKGDLAGSTR